MVTGRFCSREAARVATMQDPSGARHSAEPHVLISLEGLSGSGKTTQGRLLRQSLSTHGYQVAYLPDLATLGTDELGDALFDLFSSSGDPFMRHRDVRSEEHTSELQSRGHLV